MTRKKKARSSTCTASFKRSSNSAPRRKFYAVRRGLDGYAGVLNSWDECKLYVTGVPGAVFKSFKSHSEATAFLHSPLNAPSKPLLPAVGVTKPSMPPAGQASSRVSHPKEGEVVGESGELLVATPPCDAPTTLTAFTDGACINNGKPNSKAGYGVYFHALSPYNVSEPLPGLATNQRAEMTAMLEALRIVLQHGLLARGGHFTIYTDSQVCF